MTIPRSLIVVFLFWSSCGVSAPAQGPESVHVVIKVIDQTGAVIPSAQISVFPTPNPGPAKMETDDQGQLVLQLKPAGHALFVSASGFKSDVRHIEVDPTATNQQIPVMLTVGSYSGPIVVISEEEAANLASKLLLSAMPFRKDWFITQDEFKKMPRTTVAVWTSTGKKEIYSGVRLSDLLEQAGIPIGDAWNDISLTRYLFAAGNRVSGLFALAELQPGLHAGEILIADSLDGQALGYGRGPFMLVVSADQHRVRWIEKLHELALRP